MAREGEVSGTPIDEFFDKPYAPWLESCFRELAEIDPVSIAMQMIDKDGKVYSCYFNTSANDRAIMIDGMREDDRFAWLHDNREEIVAILKGEDGDDG